MAETNSHLILLVEDNQAISKLVTHKLKKSGFKYHHCENGSEGLEAIKKLNPDLVVLDVMLPSMNGFEVLRQLRIDAKTSDTKVIMLSSKSRMEDIEKGFDLQVEDYIEKPFKPNELLLRIRKALN